MPKICKLAPKAVGLLSTVLTPSLIRLADAWIKKTGFELSVPLGILTAVVWRRTIKKSVDIGLTLTASKGSCIDSPKLIIKIKEPVGPSSPGVLEGSIVLPAPVEGIQGVTVGLIT